MIRQALSTSIRVTQSDSPHYYVVRIVPKVVLILWKTSGVLYAGLEAIR